MRPEPDVNQLTEYLSFAKDLAAQAGRLSLGYFRTVLAVEKKPDGTPVTSADREIEKHVRAIITREYPLHGLLGEEAGETTPGALWRWVVDPIDGTQAFIHGVPLFATLIALEHRGRSVLGVIHCPALSETVAAAIGCGCTFNDRPCRVSQVTELTEARVNVTDYGDLMKRSPRFAAALLSTARMCRGWGDAFSYLLVATGRAEIAVDSAVSIWDCAPLKPIIEEAGGIYTDFAGAPLTHTGTALASNGLLHAQVLNLAKLDHGDSDGAVGSRDPNIGAGVHGGSCV
jgi:histidinol-phosphatase